MDLKRSDKMKKDSSGEMKGKKSVKESELKEVLYNGREVK
jgi:hypothetical protein